MTTEPNTLKDLIAKCRASSDYFSSNTPDYKDLRETERVFVYGTLMRGFPNDWALKNTETQKHSQFVALAHTLDRFKMINLGQYPGLLRNPPPSEEDDLKYVSMIDRMLEDTRYRYIVGEVFEVKKDLIKVLDTLEGNGQFYYRDKIPVKYRYHDHDTNKSVMVEEYVWAYILMNPRLYKDTPVIRTEDYRYFSWKSHCAI